MTFTPDAPPSTGHDVVAAEFATPLAMACAIEVAGMKGWQVMDTFAPYTLPSEFDRRLARRRSSLPLLALVGGIVGGVGAYVVQWWTSTRSYPMNVGGRPLPAIPAFIPIVFESIVLGAALLTVIGWLVTLGLPRLWAPIDEVAGFESASIDRFWAVLAVPGSMDRAGAERLLRQQGATLVSWMGEPP